MAENVGGDLAPEASGIARGVEGVGKLAPPGLLQFVCNISRGSKDCAACGEVGFEHDVERAPGEAYHPGIAVFCFPEPCLAGLGIKGPGLDCDSLAGPAPAADQERHGAQYVTACGRLPDGAEERLRLLGGKPPHPRLIAAPPAQASRWAKTIGGGHIQNRTNWGYELPGDCRGGGDRVKRARRPVYCVVINLGEERLGAEIFQDAGQVPTLAAAFQICERGLGKG
jgi:hypothetical protein